MNGVKGKGFQQYLDGLLRRYRQYGAPKDNETGSVVDDLQRRRREREARREAAYFLLGVMTGALVAVAVLLSLR